MLELACKTNYYIFLYINVMFLCIILIFYLDDVYCSLKRF